jgi:peptidyl-tRNA hydrolase, PTH1 family
MTWIVAGLGNPGERYAGTRHNLGYRTVEELASRNSERFKKVRFVPVEVAEITHEGERLLLGRSQRFYNESGEVYASLARKRDVPPERIVVVHDDIDLAFGALRIKQGGSAGGNRGVESFVRALRTPDFYRVRLGVGRPPGRQDPVDFVLQPFGKRQEADVRMVVDDAADAVLSLVREGLVAAQDRYNRSTPRA